MVRKNELVETKKNAKLLNMLQKEINDEYEEIIKTKLKDKIRQVKMAEITLNNLKDELKKMLDKKQVFTEEELLFNEE